MGCSNETSVIINSVETTALTDSGSMVTTISEEFYKTLSPLPPLYDVELKVEGAGGNAIQHLGCMECFVEVPFLAEEVISVGAIVVLTMQYSLKVPVIIGTNVISLLKEKCNKAAQVPKQWNNAFISVQQSRIGVVKYMNWNDIVIQPVETQTITGFVRNARNVEAAITENTEGASTKLGVCPRIVSLEKVGNYQRVPVRIFNMSAKVLTIKPNTNICELHEVKVLRNVDPFQNKEKNAQVNQISVEKEAEPTLPSGVTLDDSALTDKQKEQLTRFLSNWKGIFSTGITDIGNCDLVQHKIKLKDSETFKDPHRRILPALFFRK